MDDILILTDEATNFGFENESGMIIITNDVCWSNPGQKTIRAKRFYFSQSAKRVLQLWPEMTVYEHKQKSYALLV